MGIMLDTVQIHQSLVIPASKGVKATPVDVDGYAVLPNDQLYEVMQDICDSLSRQQQTLDQLSMNVNGISSYGVGFDDTINVIAIPLIIALFAFAFPFLFTVITHINNKYGSEHISTMFKSDIHYKRFMNVTKMGAVYLIIIAFITLVLRGEWHDVTMTIVNWMSVLMAAVYSYSTYQFVKTCVSYNDTQELLKLIREKYVEDLIGASKGEEALDRMAARTKYKFWKSENWKKYYCQSLRFRKPFLKFNVDTHHVERLIDLSKYAISHHEDTLFSQLLFTMDELTVLEKKIIGDKKAYTFRGLMSAGMLRHTKTFYEAVHEHYALYGNNKEIEARLLSGQLRALNRSLFPNDSDIVSVMKSVVNGVERGNTTLFDKYIQESLYGYDFIRCLPQVAYVRGYDEEGQRVVGQQFEKAWNELREIHFLTAAYLFSKRHYEIIAPLLSNKTGDIGGLYPTTGPEVLRIYLRCKTKQNEEGKYSYWMTEKLFDQSTDIDMLEKYATALLMITNKKAEVSKLVLSPDEVGKLKNEKNRLAAYAEENRNDSDLIRQYPKMLQVDFGLLFDESIKVIERNFNLGDKKEPCKFFVMINKVLELLLYGRCEEPKPTIFEMALDKQTLRNVDDMADSVLFRNKPLVGFLGSEINGKAQSVEMGIMTCCYDKRLFIGEKMDWFMYFKHLFAERVCYMFFRVLKGLEHEEVEKNVAEFESYVQEFTGGHPEEYAIIDVDSMFKHILDVRLSDEKLFDVDYYETDMTAGRYTRDLPELAEFEKKLIIMRKENLPALVPVGDFKGPETNVTDDSDKDKGRVSAWLKVNPHMKLVYSNDCQYVVVKPITIKD